MKFLALIATAAAVRLNDMESELPSVSDIMKACDTNGNGKLNFKEVKSCLTGAVKDKKMTEADAKKAGELILKAAYITENTFVKAAVKDFGATKAEAETIFDHVDTNENGSLSYDECKAALEWAIKNGKMKASDLDEAKWYLAKKAKIGPKGIAAALKEW